MSEKALTPFQRSEAYLLEKYDLRYNEVSNQVEFRQKDSNDDFKELNSSTIYRELEHNGYKISIANLEVILRSDFVATHNPFFEYFEKLPEWTYTDEDHIDKLANHVTAYDQKRFNYHLKKALVRTVAGIMQPGYFNKHAFIIVGKAQHSGKTTYIRFLVPPELQDYFTENISTTDKDGLISLSENFIINLDELAMLGKADINKLKSMFSMQQIKVRHPFGKKAQSTPRRASFFGSTNEDDFLIDSTGSVRWLCLEIESINFDYSNDGNIDINMVWAQAYQLFKSKSFKYDLTKQDLLENEVANLKFQKNTPEYDLLKEHYYPGTPELHDGFYTATQFLGQLNLKSTFFKLTPEKVGKALTALGFSKKSKRLDDTNPVYGYFFKYRSDFEVPFNEGTTLSTDDNNNLIF
jgi:predicted P-loop ATPase